MWVKFGYCILNMIRIALEIKCSLPWFTGYSFIEFYWNPSVTFSAIRFAILNTCPDPGPRLRSESGSKPNQSCRPPQLSTHKISSISVHNQLVEISRKNSKIGWKSGSWIRTMIRIQLKNVIISSRPRGYRPIKFHQNLQSITFSDIPMKLKNPV